MSAVLKQVVATLAAEAKRAEKIERTAKDVVDIFNNLQHLGENELRIAIRVLERALR